MSISKIQKNDTVIVLAGKDKGRTGQVLKVNGFHAVVQGLNLRTHYVKRDAQRGIEGL